jgi:hypothetical protein
LKILTLPFQDKLKDMCDGIDEAICLIAAVIHDVDHPGKNRLTPKIYNFHPGINRLIPCP